ncbi:hypothetical protein P886_4709 [Alteromonadaceae bacterium 2753L.S.0a.02]|nr:hypothetical protein P886_4709 [Alteromonadaceae bacterium 2753L.S.0a.02]
MIKCMLHGFGECNGKLSREHYISDTVLQALSINGGMVIGGLPWQPQDKFQNIGISSLQSKTLCEKHNSSLSEMDAAAGDLVRTLDNIDKAPNLVQNDSLFDGRVVERWLLKVISGLVAGPGVGNGTVPESWKEILVGGAWPQGWGLYLPSSSDPQILSREFYIETMVNPESKEILGCKYKIAGVGFNLLLGKPDNPTAFGLYRPRGLIFKATDLEKRVELDWDNVNDKAIIYTKTGTTSNNPPHHDGWER